MKIKLSLLLIIVFSASEIIAQTYKIDASHSAVQVQVERFGVIDVSGRFKNVEGDIYYDPEELSKTSARSVIKVHSYDANNKGGEDAVKGVFLEADTFPEIVFKSTKCIEKEGISYLLGDLTIHGVTKQIELPFTIKGPLLDLPTRKQSIAFNASIIINRQDYNIAFDRQLPNGIKLVGNDVKITLMILGIAE